jgi:mannose/fructose/N-acetylgalactosamine-specific phosphotransferase system component IIB
MIKLARIDDRLVHGQVAFTWVSSLGIDCLLVANDKISKDEFQKMAMGLAKPPMVKLLIMTLADSIAFLTDNKSKNLKILLLVNCINDSFTIASGVPEIQSINFGGIRTKEGSRLISKAIAVSDDDIPIIKQLLEKGLELEIRQVPTDKKQFVKNLI